MNRRVTTRFCEFVCNVQCLKKVPKSLLQLEKIIFAVDYVLVVSSEIFKPGCQVENINVKFVVNINIRIFARRQKHKLKFNSYESEQKKNGHLYIQQSQRLRSDCISMQSDLCL